MHKNYNSCLHILDMNVERGGGGRHQFSHRKQILVSIGIPLDLSIPTEMISIEPLVDNEKSSKTPKKLKIIFSD